MKGLSGSSSRWVKEENKMPLVEYKDPVIDKQYKKLLAAISAWLDISEKDAKEYITLIQKVSDEKRAIEHCAKLRKG